MNPIDQAIILDEANRQATQGWQGKRWISLEFRDALGFSFTDLITMVVQGTMHLKQNFTSEKFWAKADEFANWNGKYPLYEGGEDESRPGLCIVSNAGNMAPCTSISIGDTRDGNGNIVHVAWGMTCSIIYPHLDFLIKVDCAFQRDASAGADGVFYMKATITDMKTGTTSQ